MNYYYLAASLPALSLESAPPLSPEDFRRLCREQLAARDFAEMEDLLGFTAGARVPRGDFARAWSAAETRLRNAIVRVRAARLRRDAAPHLRPEEGIDPAADRAAADAYARATPAERELALDRQRWRMLDELAAFDPFSLRAVLAYALKLRIADRWARLDEGAGARAASALVEAAAPPTAA